MSCVALMHGWMRTGRRRHKLSADRVYNRDTNNGVDFRYCLIAQRPAHDLPDGVELRGPARAHQRYTHTRLIERPSQRKVHHALAVVIDREAIQRLYRAQVLAVAWRQKLGVGVALIVAVKARVGLHAPA